MYSIKINLNVLVQYKPERNFVRIVSIRLQAPSCVLTGHCHPRYIFGPEFFSACPKGYEKLCAHDQYYYFLQ